MSEKENLGSVEVPLSEGIKWADKYKKGPGADEDGDKKVTGYLIPLATLNGVLSIPDIDAVRAYKGINNAGEQVLMFVGARLDPKTGIYKDVYQKGIYAEDGGDGDYVYDATSPCPPNGDPESPL